MFISLRFRKDWSKSRLDPVAHNASVKCDRMRSQKIRRRPESCHAYHPQVSPRCHLITMSYSVVKMISRQWLFWILFPPHRRTPTTVEELRLFLCPPLSSSPVSLFQHSSPDDGQLCCSSHSHKMTEKAVD